MAEPHPCNAGEGPQCLNADGVPVDWWVAIKPPSSSSLLYLDSQTPEADSTKWSFRLDTSQPSLDSIADHCRMHTPPMCAELMFTHHIRTYSSLSLGA